LKTITSEIYEKINTENNILPLKTLMNVSGLKSREIKTSVKVHSLDIVKLMENYCLVLGIDFQTQSVLKEKIANYKLTGSQPLTIVGGLIYIHVKTLSMKTIAKALGINTISIQRFAESNDFSRRK